MKNNDSSYRTINNLYNRYNTKLIHDLKKYDNSSLTDYKKYKFSYKPKIINNPEQGNESQDNIYKDKTNYDYQENKHKSSLDGIIYNEFGEIDDHSHFNNILPNDNHNLGGNLETIKQDEHLDVTCTNSKTCNNQTQILNNANEQLENTSLLENHNKGNEIVFNKFGEITYYPQLNTNSITNTIIINDDNKNTLENDEQKETINMTKPSSETTNNVSENLENIINNDESNFGTTNSDKIIYNEFGEIIYLSGENNNITTNDNSINYVSNMNSDIQSVNNNENLIEPNATFTLEQNKPSQTTVMQITNNGTQKPYESLYNNIVEDHTVDSPNNDNSNNVILSDEIVYNEFGEIIHFPDQVINKTTTNNNIEYMTVNNISNIEINTININKENSTSGMQGMVSDFHPVLNPSSTIASHTEFGKSSILISFLDLHNN